MLANSLGASKMVTMFGFLGTTALALRFNVAVLLLAIVIGWMLVLASGILTASSGASITSHMVLVAIILQLGYLAGFILQWALLASRRHSWSTKSAAMPDGRF
jgi:hypothetical protein